MSLILNKKLKNFVVTVRFTILSIFIFSFSLGMLLLLGMMHHRMTVNTTFTSTNLLKQASETVYKEIVDTQMQSTQILSETLAELIAQGILNVDNLKTYLPYTYNLLRSHTPPIVQEITWGDEKGNSYLQEKRQDDTIITEVVRHPGMFTTFYRDENEKIIRSKTKKIDYDPRKRPWYLAAKNENEFTWTDLFIYRLASEGLLGAGAVTPVYYPNGKLHGVVFIGVRMDVFGKAIQNIRVTKHSTINIMTQDGKLFATTNTAIQPKLAKNAIDIHSLNIPGLVSSFNHYVNTGENEFIINENGKSYVASYNSLPQKWLIAVIAPESDFIGDIKKANIITLATGFIILVLGILIISKLVDGIVRPLKKIVKEAEKIKNFNLDHSKPIISRIKEVSNLATAMRTMKNGLRSFQKYVPAALVRQLIERGEDAKIGGTKQQLAILFSDIADFTTISENMPANDLMQHLCNYFDELSHIIIQNRGTIDKYIGDAIMAFWGAPLPEESPCHQAAKTALECKKRLEYLNLKWQSENKPAFHTRFGIHLGEAIVGNLGSTERLSYTAIGDSINIASRLEGANKLYNTQIIVSEPVYLAIKNAFTLRMIDKVTLKGKKEATYLYELIAENNEIF